MTSARDLAVVREGVSLGVVQYVLKPFTFASAARPAGAVRRVPTTSGRRPGRRGRPGAGQSALARAGRAAEGTERADVWSGVTQALREGSPEGLTAAVAAETVGISRITARRYLEHLVDSARGAQSAVRGVGRPGS